MGRGGYRFDPNKTKTVMVAASRANELLDTPLLDTKVVSADSFAELPPGVEIDINATDAAKRTAQERGVDLMAVEGSGKGGQITKEDVIHFATAGGELNKTDRDHYLELHKAGGGSATVTTLDPVEMQAMAQHQALEELQAAERELRATQGGTAHDAAPSVGPDQTSELGQQQDASSPSPPVDVLRAGEEQHDNQPGAQEPKES